MKINSTPVAARDRQSRLLGLLVLPALFASATMADVIAETKPRPIRLPMVKSAAPEQQPFIDRIAADSDPRAADSGPIAADAGPFAADAGPIAADADPGAARFSPDSSSAAKNVDPPMLDAIPPAARPPEQGAQVTSDSPTSLLQNNGHPGNTDITEIEANGTTGAGNPPPARWLRSSTSSASAEVARRLIVQATREYNVGASLSAEASAWDAIRWAAEAVDLSARERGGWPPRNSSGRALHRLEVARLSIREARDFSGAYGTVDAKAIARMAKSHTTDVLDEQSAEGLSATDAADCYLDYARAQLAPIAAQSIEAAQAMDLLAAIYLQRADSRTLPSSTALCLRRAALQGQPDNASLASRLGMHLADVGLMDEARWALEHSLSIDPDSETAEALVKVLRRTGHDEEAVDWIATLQNRSLAAVSTPVTSTSANHSPIKIPQITELSPADFAALSIPVNQLSSGNNGPTAKLASAKTKITEYPAGIDLSAEAETGATIESSDGTAKKPGAMRRLVNSFKRFW